LLTGENASDLSRLPRVRLRARDDMRPGLTVGRVAREEAGDGIEILCVVGGEAADPGEAPEIYRDSCRHVARRGSKF
jgi:hypothetical protein